MSEYKELINSVRELTDAVSKQASSIDKSVLALSVEVEKSIANMEKATAEMSSSLLEFAELSGSDVPISMGKLNVITAGQDRVLPVGSKGICFSMRVDGLVNLDVDQVLLSAPDGEKISVAGTLVDSVRVNSTGDLFNFYRLAEGWSL